MHLGHDHHHHLHSVSDPIDKDQPGIPGWDKLSFCDQNVGIIIGNQNQIITCFIEYLRSTPLLLLFPPPSSFRRDASRFWAPAT